MAKLTFVGAGSTVFVKNILGDCMLTPALKGMEFALYDIDERRLDESYQLLQHLKKQLGADVHIHKYLNRKEALKGSSYVINAIQVGGYKPSTVIDFEVPKKYGLQQTIGDTIGVGGLFRTLRTAPAMLDIAADIEEVCPDAWLLNYTNPMAALTGIIAKETNVQAVGLCHSVQVCVPELFDHLDISQKDVKATIAGINHMAWLLDVSRNGEDLYPEIKKRAAEKQKGKHEDMVRFELMDKFGYYVTESSEHNAEYHPYFIKSAYPELIERFNIPLDEYPRRCETQISEWEARRDSIIHDESLTHERSREYASHIIEAMETDQPTRIAGNVLNSGGLISNLPSDAVVEVPCLVDRNGVTPTHAGRLPEQLAALNRTNINTQLLTMQANRTRKKEYVYQAAMLDPHTSAELSLDDIVSLCDDLFEAHGDWLPNYK